MDKKLLLALQYETNRQGINLPWNAIGKVMGEHITGGAVIQHLSKVRSRMVDQGLDVPPPLKRGGGSKISTGYSVQKRRSTPTKNAKAQPTFTKPRKPSKLDTSSKDLDSEESDEEEWENDFEIEYGKPRCKRLKTETKGKEGQQNFKTDDSDAEVDTPTEDGQKRKRQSSSKPSTRGCLVNYRDSNEEDFEDDDMDIENKDDEKLHVAMGAPFLQLDDYNQRSGHTVTASETLPQPRKSLIVTLFTTPRNFDPNSATEKDLEVEGASESGRGSIGGGFNDNGAPSYAQAQKDHITPENENSGTMPPYTRFDAGHNGGAGAQWESDAWINQNNIPNTHQAGVSDGRFHGGQSMVGQSSHNQFLGAEDFLTDFPNFLNTAPEQQNPTDYASSANVEFGDSMTNGGFGAHTNDFETMVGVSGNFSTHAMPKNMNMNGHTLAGYRGINDSSIGASGMSNNVRGQYGIPSQGYHGHTLYKKVPGSMVLGISQPSGPRKSKVIRPRPPQTSFPSNPTSTGPSTTIQTPAAFSAGTVSSFDANEFAADPQNTFANVIWGDYFPEDFKSTFDN